MSVVCYLSFHALIRKESRNIFQPNDVVALFMCVEQIYKVNIFSQQNSPHFVKSNQGVFLVSAKNAFVPVERDNSVNTYSRFSTVPRGSERSEWASPWTKHSEAERCEASERSERCEQTNVASDRVAHSKRDCLWLETPPLSTRSQVFKCGTL